MRRAVVKHRIITVIYKLYQQQVLKDLGLTSGGGSLRFRRSTLDFGRNIELLRVTILLMRFFSEGFIGLMKFFTKSN